jgi:hypothetical protein
MGVGDTLIVKLKTIIVRWCRYYLNVDFDSGLAVIASFCVKKIWEKMYIDCIIFSIVNRVTLTFGTR